MPATVLDFLSLFCEQSPHRQLFIEVCAGCSCVWILLDPYPHDHHFLFLLVTVNLYQTEPTVALGQIDLATYRDACRL